MELSSPVLPVSLGSFPEQSKTFYTRAFFAAFKHQLVPGRSPEKGALFYDLFYHIYQSILVQTFHCIPKAPTPGRITLSAARSSSLSLVMTGVSQDKLMLFPRFLNFLHHSLLQRSWSFLTFVFYLSFTLLFYFSSIQRTEFSWTETPRSSASLGSW